MAFTSTPIDVNDVTLNVIDEGAQGEPVVVLLHGFPDSSQVWRYQIPELRKAGYRVVAPDLRGFGLSSKPLKLVDYKVTMACADVFGILIKLGIGKFHLVGHDWGALVAWGLAAIMSQASREDQLVRMPPEFANVLQSTQVKVKPEIQSLAALSVGHPQAYEDPSVAQRERSWYIYFFQFEQAVHDLQENDYQLLRDWSGGHSEAKLWIDHFEQNRPSNLEAALKWYRANTNPDHSIISTFRLPPVMVPTLGVWGGGDPHQTEEPMKKSSRFVADKKWTYHYLDGGGHWMQLDQPETVNTLLLDWLQQCNKA